LEITLADHLAGSIEGRLTGDVYGFAARRCDDVRPAIGFAKSWRVQELSGHDLSWRRYLLGISKKKTSFLSVSLPISPVSISSLSPRTVCARISPLASVTRNSAGWTKRMGTRFSLERAWRMWSLDLGPNMPPEGQIRRVAP